MSKEIESVWVIRFSDEPSLEEHLRNRHLYLHFMTYEEGVAYAKDNGLDESCVRQLMLPIDETLDIDIPPFEFADGNHGD